MKSRWLYLISLLLPLTACGEEPLPMPGAELLPEIVSEAPPGSEIVSRADDGRLLDYSQTVPAPSRSCGFLDLTAAAPDLLFHASPTAEAEAPEPDLELRLPDYLAFPDVEMKPASALPATNDIPPLTFTFKPDQPASAPSPLQPFDSAAAGSGSIGLQRQWRSDNRDELEFAWTQLFHLSRPSANAVSFKYSLPNPLGPFHLYAQEEFQANFNGSNMNKLSLGATSPTPGLLTGLQGTTLTLTFGASRAEMPATYHARHESYGLNWGTSLKLTERLSAGVNMTYSWDPNNIGTFVFLELTAPAPKLPACGGGCYEPGNP